MSREFKLSLGVHAFPATLRDHWRAVDSVEHDILRGVLTALDEIAARDCSPPRLKGFPNVNLAKRDLVVRLRPMLPSGAGADQPVVSKEALALARTLASTDLTDSGGFVVYVGLLAIASAPALAQAAAQLSSNVVMHVSCVPRLSRAIQSMESFANMESEGVSQLIVVGVEEQTGFAYDAESRTLFVPAPDTYEHLPAKVVLGCAFLALCGSPECVLKVDDDHRLKNPAELMAKFRAARPSLVHDLLFPFLRDKASIARKIVTALSMARFDTVRMLIHKMFPMRRVTPIQLGSVVSSEFLVSNARIWHYGKCTDKSLNARPLTLLGSDTWINGADGYFLNRAALLVLLWGHVYFKDHIDSGLYEDRVVSELLEKHGALLLPTRMRDALSAESEY
jgi:hypothetical protein